jgi:hypothetical protein
VEALLRIEGPFSYSVQGTSGNADPEQDPASAGPALRLRSRKVIESRVGADAALTIAFEGEPWLRLPPDPQYEAWTLNARQWLVVSMPGGELAIFPPPDEAGQ